MVSGFRVKDPQLVFGWLSSTPTPDADGTLKPLLLLAKIQGVQREQTPATSPTLETAVRLDMFPLRSPFRSRAWRVPQETSLAP